MFITTASFALPLLKYSEKCQLSKYIFFEDTEYINDQPQRKPVPNGGMTIIIMLNSFYPSSTFVSYIPPSPHFVSYPYSIPVSSPTSLLLPISFPIPILFQFRLLHPSFSPFGFLSLFYSLFRLLPLFIFPFHPLHLPFVSRELLRYSVRG